MSARGAVEIMAARIRAWSSPVHLQRHRGDESLCGVEPGEGKSFAPLDRVDLATCGVCVDTARFFGFREPEPVETAVHPDPEPLPTNYAFDSCAGHRRPEPDPVVRAIEEAEEPLRTMWSQGQSAFMARRWLIERVARDRARVRRWLKGEAR